MPDNPTTVRCLRGLAGLCLAGWSALALAQSPPQQIGNPPLPAALATALQRSGVPSASVSLLVVPAEGGAARLSHEAQAVRQPASVMKLFTSGMALQTLGPAFTWHTDAGLGGPLLANGVLAGSLYLRGSGDPSLVLEKTWLMLARWRAAGLRDIQGDIVIDRRAFVLPPHNPAAFDGRPLKPYNAGPDALLLNHQAITLRFRPDAQRNGWARVSMEPALDGVSLDAPLPLGNGACGDWREALALKLAPSSAGPSATAAPSQDTRTTPWTVSLRGTYPAACGEREWPVLWQGDGPGDLAARLLPNLWREMGGKLGGRVRTGDWPADTPVWSRWDSAPLGLVVRDINKFSNNVMARQLFLTVGITPPTGTSPRSPSPLGSLDEGGTPEQARSVVTQYVLKATQSASGSPCLDTLMLDNGSGLSRNERSSAACLGRWLQVLWASPVMPELLASLPITGQDGTTRKWQSVAGKAHIKTGSLDGVVAMAGVVEGDSGKRHIVVGIVNHPQADAARPLMEALVAWAQHDN